MPETDLDDAAVFAEKIRSIIESTSFDTAAGSIPVTVSIGVASVPHSRIASPKELIVSADKALYRAKKNGRNQVQCEKRKDPARKAQPQEEAAVR